MDNARSPTGPSAGLPHDDPSVNGETTMAWTIDAALNISGHAGALHLSCDASGSQVCLLVRVAKGVCFVFFTFNITAVSVRH